MFDRTPLVSRVTTDTFPVSSYETVEAVFEAGCEILLELRFIYAMAPQDLSFRSQVGEAITSLRRALAQVRLARIQHQSALAYGFVVGGEPRLLD